MGELCRISCREILFGDLWDRWAASPKGTPGQEECEAQGKAETEYQDRPWDMCQTSFWRAHRLAMGVTDENVNVYSNHTPGLR